MDTSQIRILELFQEISAIPRESGKEEAISDYLWSFAQSHGLSARRDAYHNCIIEKEASPGKEEIPAIFLQAHMDMVCVRTEDSDHDFSRDGIALVRDGDLIRADDTSLGADNGIGMAIALAVLESITSHPHIIAIFTVDEERGLLGVKNLDLSGYLCDTLINLDGEEEGVFLTSCAGGARCVLELPIKREAASCEIADAAAPPPPKKGRAAANTDASATRSDSTAAPPGFSQAPGGSTLALRLSGLQGGHSGLKIDQEHANAILVMERILEQLTQDTHVGLISMSGGSKENSIPAMAQATLAISAGAEEKLTAKALSLFETIKSEYAHSDDGMTLHIDARGPGGIPSPAPAHGAGLADKGTATTQGATAVQGTAAAPAPAPLKGASARKLFALLSLLPNGLIRKDLVHDCGLSSSNLGVLEMLPDKVRLSVMIRSNLESAKYEVIRRFGQLAQLSGATLTLKSDYPAWEYRRHSKLRNHLKEVFWKRFARNPRMESIHGGVECAYFAGKIPDIDMVSVGCDIFDAHSVNERFSVSSAIRTYEFIKEALEEWE
ncbi:MAG: M20/M25/M40 family metallo-hydrolase [Lachnospiraceae bacterium]|jgi:dipeptidase D|nr:M20/M25/M40 family metallo-hydrolase [Lachnospiraceae bacterium]